jgi:Zn-dependent peptidase ImmA (M78 family)
LSYASYFAASTHLYFDKRENQAVTEKLAKLLDADLRYQPFPGSLSGMMQRIGDQSVIGINSAHPSARRRFTLGHELGHLVLHSEEALHIDHVFPVAFRREVSSKAVDAREIEANQFAAELLMPLKFLRRDINRIKADLEIDDAIAALAKRYGVSSQAMTIRVSALGMISY